MSADYSVVIGGNIGSQLDFLQSELQRLRFDEEMHIKTYHTCRGELQDFWNKLVNIRTHLKRFQDEAESVRVEMAAQEVEKSYWNGELNAIQDGIDNLNLGSASRAAEAQSLREKLFLKDSLLTNIMALEEEVADTRKKQLLFSQSLKNMSTRSCTTLEVIATSASTITASMEVRQQLIVTSKHLDELENKLLSSKQQLRQVQGELERSLSQSAALRDKTVTPTGASTPDAAASMTNGDVLRTPGPGPDREDMLDLVVHGPAFTPDLREALLVPSSIIAFTPTTQLFRSPIHDGIPLYSVDEVLGGQAAVYRINGESPKTYLARVEKRIHCLQQLEAGLVSDFNSKLVQLRRHRELGREIEIKRLKVEMQVMHLEKIRAEAVASATRLSRSMERAHATPPALPAPPTMTSPEAFRGVASVQLATPTVGDDMAATNGALTRADLGLDESEGVGVQEEVLLGKSVQREEDSVADSKERVTPESEEAERRSIVASLRTLAQSLTSPLPRARTSSEVLNEEKEILRLISLYLQNHSNTNNIGEKEVHEVPSVPLERGYIRHLQSLAHLLQGVHYADDVPVESEELIERPDEGLHPGNAMRTPPKSTGRKESMSRVSPKTSFTPLSPGKTPRSSSLVSTRSPIYIHGRARLRSPHKETPQSLEKEPEHAVTAPAFDGPALHSTCIVCSRKPRTARLSAWEIATQEHEPSPGAPSSPLSALTASSPVRGALKTSDSSSMAALPPDGDAAHSPLMITRDDPLAQSAVKRREHNRHAVQSLADQLALLAQQIEQGGSSPEFHSSLRTPSPSKSSPQLSQSSGVRTRNGVAGDSSREQELMHIVQQQQREIDSLIHFKRRVEGLIDGAGSLPEATSSFQVEKFPLDEHFACDVEASFGTGFATPQLRRVIDLIEQALSDGLRRVDGLNQGHMSVDAPREANDAFELEVEVVLAKHLPVTRQITRSCDAYVEAVVVVPSETFIGTVSADASLFVQRVVDVEHDVRTGRCELRAESDEDLGTVVGYQKTSIKADTLYPEWRESLHFPHLHASAAHPHVLLLIVREPHSHARREDIIAQGWMVLGDDRLDSQWHPSAVPLRLPHAQRQRKGRHLLDPRCELRVSLRHKQTPFRRWMRVVTEARQLLVLLAPFRDEECAVEMMDDSLRRRMRCFLRSMRALRPKARGSSSRATTPTSERGSARGRAVQARLMGLRERERLEQQLGLGLREYDSQDQRRKRSRAITPPPTRRGTPMAPPPVVAPASSATARFVETDTLRGLHPTPMPRQRSIAPAKHHFPIRLGSQDRIREISQFITIQPLVSPATSLTTSESK